MRIERRSGLAIMPIQKMVNTLDPRLKDEDANRPSTNEINDQRILNGFALKPGLNLL